MHHRGCDWRRRHYLASLLQPGRVVRLQGSAGSWLICPVRVVGMF